MDSSKIDFLGASLDLKNDNNIPTENSTQNKNITSKENYLTKKNIKLSVLSKKNMLNKYKEPYEKALKSKVWEYSNLNDGMAGKKRRKSKSYIITSLLTWN